MWPSNDLLSLEENYFQEKNFHSYVLPSVLSPSNALIHLFYKRLQNAYYVPAAVIHPWLDAKIIKH